MPDFIPARLPATPIPSILVDSDSSFGTGSLPPEPDARARDAAEDAILVVLRATRRTDPWIAACVVSLSRLPCFRRAQLDPDGHLVVSYDRYTSAAECHRVTWMLFPTRTRVYNSRNLNCSTLHLWF